MSDDRWNPAEFLEELRRKRKSAGERATPADPEKVDAAKQMFSLAQEALGITGNPKVQAGDDGLLDISQLSYDFKMMSYVRSHMERIREALSNPDSGLAKQCVESDGSDLNAAGKALFEKARIADAYFTPEAYGSVLKEIVQKQGDVNTLTDNAKTMLEKGRDAADALDEFFKATLPDYAAYRKRPVKQQPEDTLPSYSDAEFLAAAVDSLSAPIQLYHVKTKQSQSSGQKPAWAIVSVDAFRRY